MIAPDEFAEVIEKIDNLRGALEIPMPAGFHVCLLYTSPSPRDRTRSRMPSSA